MSRPIKPQIHIFFPEASHRGKKVELCESFYIIHSFQRKVTQAKIAHYAEEFENEFNMAIKNTIKKNSQYPNDLFFIVLDTDINASSSNLDTVISRIQSLNKKYGKNAAIILSGRSFEVWLCMYDRQQYTTPYTSQHNLYTDVDPLYEKKEKWYSENASRLYEKYSDAKAASILSKQNVYTNTPNPPPSGFNLVINCPDFSNNAILTYLVGTTPFTYFEHLIDTIKEYE